MSKGQQENKGKSKPMALSKQEIAKRISKELKDGYFVNLGIGIPTLVANYIPDGMNVTLQSENGLLGIGPFPKEEEVDPDLINAGKQTVTELKGSSYFSSADSFAMIRGGHMDLCILGAMQVDMEGSIANWMIPNKTVKGMGGAMDLVAGTRKILIAMQHCSRTKEAKILKKCSLPLTGVHCVGKVFTDLAVLELKLGKGFHLLERAKGVSVEEIQEATEAPLILPHRGEVLEMDV